MEYYTLHKRIKVKTTLNDAWNFIKNPENLNAITPDDMEFRIISDVPETMYNGLTIAYKVKIPYLGVRDWLSEIKHIRLPYAFVDEQRIGPYKLWYHYHEIKKVEGGVEIIDDVKYQLPYGIFGRLAHALFVRKTLEKIFEYRNMKFKEMLESENG
jgi:ligand-binding SRPBCC domain-containing protein